MDLLDLFASITLDTDGYEQGLNKAQQSAESAASSITSSSNNIANSFETQNNMLTYLQEQYNYAQKAVSEISAEFNAAVSSTGAFSDEAAALAVDLEKAQKEMQSAAKQLENFEKSLEDENKSAKETSKTHGDDLNPKIKETGNEAEKSGDKVSAFGGKLQALKTAAALGASAVTAIATAAVAAGAAMVKATSDTAAYADNIDKASQKLGVSAEFYQEWEAVLQHSGTSMSSMTATFKTLANAAQDMSADQQAAFEKLGISIESVASLSTEDLFEQVISGLQQMEEGTERTAIATDLLGRGAMEMGALLNTSAEDTRKMIDTVHDLGGVMSDEAIKAGAAFQDSLQDLKTSLNGLKNNLAAEFLPSMVEVMDGLAAVFSGDNSGIEKAKEGIQNFIDELSEQLPKVADFGGEVISALLEGISDNLTDITGVAVDIIGELVTELISLAPTLVDSAVEIINQLFGFLQENAYVIADGAVSIITSLVNGISDLLPDLIPATVEIIEQIVLGITDNAGELVEAALKLIMSLGAGLIDAIPTLLSAAVKIPQSIADSLIHYDWGSVAEQTMTAIADALDNAQKHVQVALDNIFSGGTVYGGDIANVDSTDFINNMRDGIDDVANAIGTGSEWLAEQYDMGRGVIEEAQQELVNAEHNGAKIAAEGMAAYYREQAIAASKGGKEVSETVSTSGEEIAETTKKSTEKQKSVLVQNMEALERLYKQRKITEEQYQKQRLEYLEKNRNEESDEWTKYYDNVQTYYEKLAQTEEQAAQKAAQEREKSFKTIIDAYSKQVEQIQNKISSFADKLTGAYKDFYTFETDEAGNITSAYATDKMTQAGKQLEEYYNQLLEFQERGIGGDMISQLADFSQEEGLATLEYWNSLTDQEIKNLQAHYDKVTNLSNKVSELLHKGEAESTAEAFANEIAGAVENDEQFKDIGEMMLSGIIDGLNNGAFDITEAASRISGAFNSYFESGTVSSGYAVESPNYTQTVATTSFPVAESAATAYKLQATNAPISGESGFNIEIHIGEFNNYTEDDVETLADKVLIAIQNKINQRQAAYS